MIGNITQYLLYGVFWLTVLLIVGGAYVLRLHNRNVEVSLEPWLAGLALVAASAPYLGLFGTVWHIIQSLAGIGSGNLNVAAIAQPIGEALYATLWGLGCAIPALIAHRIFLYLSLSTPAEVVQHEQGAGLNSAEIQADSFAGEEA